MGEQERKRDIAQQISHLREEQAVVEEYLREIANVDPTQDDIAGKYLTFWCGKQFFGLSISQVVQVIRIQRITPLPDYPFYVKGIISLRCEIIPIIDMNLRLGKPETEHNERTCIIIISLKEGSVGLVVDGVDSVEEISDEEISPPPGNRMDTSQYIIGLAERTNIVMLLDVERLLSEEEISTLLRAKDNDQSQQISIHNEY